MERNELAHLRKENKQLRREKEILKRANAFFAKEMKRNITLLKITLKTTLYGCYVQRTKSRNQCLDHRI